MWLAVARANMQPSDAQCEDACHFEGGPNGVPCLSLCFLGGFSMDSLKEIKSFRASSTKTEA